VARNFGFQLDRETHKLKRRDNPNSLIAKWGKRPVATITERNVLDFIDGIADRGSPIMANRTLAHLRKFFKWAKSRKMIEATPCVDMTPPGKERKVKRVLKDAEIRALWTVSKALGYPQGSAYRMLILTGQRLSIVAQCEMSHLDRGEKLWTISSEQEGSKASPHVLPLTGEIEAILDECPHQGPFVFSTTRGMRPLTMGSKLKSEVDRLMLAELKREAEEHREDPKKVKLEPWTNHDIRRTFRTRISSLPVPDGHITRELLIGHNKPDLHEIYDQHQYLDQKREALQLWAARLRSIVEQPPSNVVKFPVQA
jgi:integrase